jgi:branched-chain amino acid transport system substrate-binding protein
MTQIRLFRENSIRAIWNLLVFTLLVILSPVVVWAQSLILQQGFKIAVVRPLTPSSKAFGIPHLQGITLAVDEYNQKHSSKQVQLEIFDDQANPSISASIAKKLSQSGSLAMLGPANSSSCAAVLLGLQEQHIRFPTVSALCSATNLTENLHNEFFYRANASDRKRLSALLSSIFNDENLRPRRVVAFYEKADAYGEGLVQDAKAWLASNYSNYLQSDFLDLGYPRDITTTDAQDLIATATDKGFGAEKDAVLLLGLGPDAIRFIKSLRDKNVKATIYFNEPDWSVFKLAAQRGIPVKGVRVLSVWWPDTPVVNSFRQSFLKRFNEEPSFSAALSYDAARLILRSLDSIAEGQAISKNLQPLRDQIATNLRNDIGDPLEFVIGGDHKFQNSEY